MKILYVEDDPFDADLTRRAMLKTAPHFSLEIARSAREARDLLENLPPYDLMLTDLRLPDGSGMALLAYVRERRLPMAVVVITGQGDEETAVSALKAGANDYLVKRQDYLDHLAATLEMAYRRYQAEAMRSERPLRVLYLENDINDIDAIQHHFSSHAHHIHIKVVPTVREVLELLPAGLPEPDWDAILLDYRQQGLNALDLLKELRQVRGLDLPIVLLSAQGDEELAVQALRLGAYDYVVKNPGYLFRLPGLLENAYHRFQLTREQAALRASEARFRRLAENAPDIIYRYRGRASFVLEYVSPAVETITGYTPEALYERREQVFRFIHPDDLPLVQQALAGNIPRGAPVEFRAIHKNGHILWLEGRNVTVFDTASNAVLHEGILRDITERKLAEERIFRQIQRLNALRAIDAAINANLGLSQTLDILLGQVVAQLGVDAAVVLFYDAETCLLRQRANTGFYTEHVGAQGFEWSAGPAGIAARENRLESAERDDIVTLNSTLTRLWDDEQFQACFSAPLIAKQKVLGVLEVYLRRTLNPDAEWLSFLETLAGQAALAIDNTSLLEGLQQVNLELLQAYDTTLEGWVNALDLRDRETEEHTRRVTEMTLHLASVMGIDEKEMVQIKRGALLHDIGKVGIPDGILLKPGPLNQSEWETMHRHPEYAFQLLSGIDYLRQALDIPYYHHERWDGSGYPKGLKGEEIPLAARIFAIVDVWDALSSDRPYRARWAPEKIIDYIRAQSGQHFDPEVVAAFLPLITNQALITDQA